jgi:ABC-type Fe2+-enterobactin transport system substrate-binding protein
MSPCPARPLLIRLASGLALFCMAALAQAGEPGWPRQVQGLNGSVTIEQPPQRIVSTSVTLTGSLLALGAPVVASGATTPNSRFADDQGYFRQWGAQAKARGVKRLYIGEASAEAVASQAPDLILVSATGGDSALALVEQLSAIAPTLVVDYETQSWQQLEQQLGLATGRETQARALIEEFAARQAALKQQMAVPQGPVSAFVYNAPARQANTWTQASPQGQLLHDSGFTLALPPAGLGTSDTLGKRKDIVQLGGENVAKGLTGDTFLVFAAEPTDLQALRDNALLKHLPAIAEHRLYALGIDTFRLDYYSASNLLTRLEGYFPKP